MYSIISNHYLPAHQLINKASTSFIHLTHSRRRANFNEIALSTETNQIGIMSSTATANLLIRQQIVCTLSWVWCIYSRFASGLHRYNILYINCIFRLYIYRGINPALFRYPQNPDSTSYMSSHGALRTFKYSTRQQIQTNSSSPMTEHLG